MFWSYYPSYHITLASLTPKMYIICASSILICNSAFFFKKNEIFSDFKNWITALKRIACNYWSKEISSVFLYFKAFGKSICAQSVSTSRTKKIQNQKIGQSYLWYHWYLKHQVSYTCFFPGNTLLVTFILDILVLVPYPIKTKCTGSWMLTFLQ